MKLEQVNLVVESEQNKAEADANKKALDEIQAQIEKQRIEHDEKLAA